MGDDLYRLAQVIAAALFAQHGFVDLSGREVVDLAHARGNEALVVAQIQIRLGPVFGHEDFPMLEGAHGARVDVDVGIRSEEHTSELQSLMRISSAVFCLKKKNHKNIKKTHD